MTTMSGRNWIKVAVTVALGGLLVSPAAAAVQMDATDAPEVSGELELVTESCQNENEKHEGAVVARGKTCLRIYSYDPGAENDADRNYGVAWLQSNVNSRLGWCAAKVLSDIDLPGSFQVEARAPRSMDVRRRKTYETVLAADAGGNAAETAEDSAIRQAQILYPREVRTSILSDPNVFRLRWVGLRNEKLGFATGAEVSWSSGSSPDPVSYRLNYELKRGDC